MQARRQLNDSQSIKETKAKINKWDYTKPNSFCTFFFCKNKNKQKKTIQGWRDSWGCAPA
jgi:hypothetical protein